MRKILVLAACAFCLVNGMGIARAQEKEKAVAPPPGGSPAAEGIRMLDAGALAPEFSVKDTEGVPFHIAEERGRKPVLLFFWSIFCEPCRLELPVLQKMHAQHKDSGLTVVGVSLDGEPLKSSIRGFVKQEGYTFKVLIDELDSREMFKAADSYGVAGTPALFLVDRAGKIILARSGRVKEEELEKAIQSVLKR
jgi:peroxiredoxin